MSTQKMVAKIIATVLILTVSAFMGLFGLFVFFFLAAKPVLLAAIIIGYVDVVLILILCIWDVGLLRRLKYIPLFILALCAVVGGVLGGYAVWEDNLPQVSDQLVLREYIPFDPASRLARLEEAATLSMDKPLPRLDCATALYPLMAAFVEAAYPPGANYSPYDEESVAQCTGTTSSYDRLVAGEVDIILVAQPSDAQLQMAADAGVKLVTTPIGLEAFVFFVNARNPVDGLTTDQLQGIYSGSITNWSQVGGSNQSIRAFQRPKNSGSQTALESFMKDSTLMEAPAEDVAGLMGGIIRQTASYKNHSNAIGYSFRYYSTQMVQNDQIRLLSIDGVAPTTQTIRDGSYPIASYYYAVTVEGRDNAQSRTLIDWILSDQGRLLTEQTGYVAIPQ